MRVNYKESHIFKFKFKRDPKDWSIEELHQLYLDSYSRTARKWEVLSSIIKRIADELPDAKIYRSQETRVVYLQKDNEIVKRVFSYQVDTGGWSFGPHEDLNLSTSENRDYKLELILSSPKNFELGHLFEKYVRENLHLHRIPWEALSEKVETLLREKFRDKKAPEYFTIDICKKKYIVHCENQHRYNKFYKKFCLKNENLEIEI